MPASGGLAVAQQTGDISVVARWPSGGGGSSSVLWVFEGEACSSIRLVIVTRPLSSDCSTPMVPEVTVDGGSWCHYYVCCTSWLHLVAAAASLVSPYLHIPSTTHLLCWVNCITKNSNTLLIIAVYITSNYSSQWMLIVSLLSLKCFGIRPTTNCVGQS